MLRGLPGLKVSASTDGWLRHDVLAGVVITALLVPQGMAYAELAGLPPVTGSLHDGPRAGRVRGLRAVADPGARAGLGARPAHRGDGPAARRRRRRPGEGGRAGRDAGPAHGRRSASSAGLARLGVVTELLSKPVRVGYLNGIARRWSSSASCPKLFGFASTPTGCSTSPRRSSRGSPTARRSAPALLIGLASLAVILGVPAACAEGAGRPRRRRRRALAVVRRSISPTRACPSSAPIPSGFPRPTHPARRTRRRRLAARRGRGHGARRRSPTRARSRAASPRSAASASTPNQEIARARRRERRRPGCSRGSP